VLLLLRLTLPPPPHTLNFRWMQMNPAKYDPTEDCSSVRQYPLIDSNSPFGWYDSTYTLVQELLP
jgi:hypothetical protein